MHLNDFTTAFVYSALVWRLFHTVGYHLLVMKDSLIYRILFTISEPLRLLANQALVPPRVKYGAA